MANSLKSQLFEFICKKGRKKYSPQRTYINYTLKRCIKKQCQTFIPCKSVLIRKVEL